MSQDAAKIVKIHRPVNQVAVVTQPETQVQPELEIELFPEPVEHLECLVTPVRDDSIYGSGWSLAELMTEFTGR